jgi:hypothetical protein
MLQCKCSDTENAFQWVCSAFLDQPLYSPMEYAPGLCSNGAYSFSVARVSRKFSERRNNLDRETHDISERALMLNQEMVKLHSHMLNKKGTFRTM